MEKSTQISAIIKYQKNVPKDFDWQLKTIVLKYFQKNVNMLLKKKRFQSVLLTTCSDSDREDSDEENSNEENYLQNSRM